MLLHLPTLRETVVRAAGKDRVAIRCVAGPDDAGRIAFLENRWQRDSHALVVIRTDGSGEMTIRERAGSAYSGAIGEMIALSAGNGRIAFVADTEGGGVQQYQPSVHLTQGRLMMLEIAGGLERVVATNVLDGAITWLPDNRRVAYASLVPREVARNARLGPPSDEYGSTLLAHWALAPVVRVVDVETMEDEIVDVGWDPVVDADGSRLLYSDYERRWRITDLTTQRFERVVVPGLTRPIAFVGPGKLLFLGYPTEGLDATWTTTGSPLVRHWQMRSLKVTDLTGGAFQTVVPYVDPRRSIGVGPSADR